MDFTDVIKLGLPLAGAAAGTAIAPGAGTMIGGMAGGMLGGLIPGGGGGGVNGSGMLTSLLGDPYAGERLDAMKHSQGFLDQNRLGHLDQRRQASDAMQGFFSKNMDPLMKHMFGGNFGGNAGLMDPAWGHGTAYNPPPSSGGGAPSGGNGQQWHYSGGPNDKVGSDKVGLNGGPGVFNTMTQDMAATAANGGDAKKAAIQHINILAKNGPGYRG